MADDVYQKINILFQENRSRVLASLISSLGDFDLAEDVLQDAMLSALEKWSQSGIPPNPLGWLTLTAKRKAIDQFRRNKNLSKKLEAVHYLDTLEHQTREEAVDHAYPDDRLKLIFTVCHPALSREGRIALTLRTLGGLSTEEIANSFLVSKETMAQRLVRTKRKLRDARIPYRVPPAHLLFERIDLVLIVIYLIFNEGYFASGGETLIRHDLCREAIRLGRLLVRLLEKEKYSLLLPEALGLLALMLLNDLRREARTTPSGELVLLEEQDRSLWDGQAIEEGLFSLETARLLQHLGPYQI